MIDRLDEQTQEVLVGGAFHLGLNVAQEQEGLEAKNQFGPGPVCLYAEYCPQ